MWLAQSGDEPHDIVVQTMDPGLKQMLWEQDYRNVTHVSNRERVVICDGVLFVTVSAHHVTVFGCMVRALPCAGQSAWLGSMCGAQGCASAQVLVRTWLCGICVHLLGHVETGTRRRSPCL